MPIALSRSAVVRALKSYAGDSRGAAGGRPVEMPLPPETAAGGAQCQHDARTSQLTQGIADSVQAGTEVGLTSPARLRGRQRLAFGLIGAHRRFIYGNSAL
jgi:hypothetical protein